MRVMGKKSFAGLSKLRWVEGLLELYIKSSPCWLLDRIFWFIKRMQETGEFSNVCRNVGSVFVIELRRTLPLDVPISICHVSGII